MAKNMNGTANQVGGHSISLVKTIIAPTEVVRGYKSEDAWHVTADIRATTGAREW